MFELTDFLCLSMIWIYVKAQNDKFKFQIFSKQIYFEPDQVFFVSIQQAKF